MRSICYLFIIVLFGVIRPLQDNSAQAQNTFQAKNIAVLGQDKFSKGGSGDVWGVRMQSGSNRDYALSTIDGGLSLAVVHASSPNYYDEVAYVNHDDYATGTNMLFTDVETFVANGVTFAALAIDQSEDYVVYIINLDSAITAGLSAQNHFVPISTVQVAVIPRWAPFAEAHTLTIENNYLYVATQQQYIDVWNLSNPASPSHVGGYKMPDQVLGTDNTYATVHEMFVEQVKPDTATAYVAYTRGGLWIVDIALNSISDSIYVANQMYDSDRRYANMVISPDTAFDWRLCHSAWPTDDRKYVITTDELSLGSGVYVYPRQYIANVELEAPNLKVWKVDQMGADSTSGLNSLTKNHHFASQSTTMVPCMIGYNRGLRWRPRDKKRAIQHNRILIA